MARHQGAIRHPFVVFASTLICCCAMATADDLGLDENLVTPRSLYRNNPQRIVEKGGSSSRDARFVVESGLVRLPESKTAQTTLSQPQLELKSPPLRKPETPLVENVAEHTEPRGNATVLCFPIAQRITGNEKYVTQQRQPFQTLPEKPEPSASPQAIAMIPDELRSVDRNDAPSSTQPVPRLRIAPTLQLQPPALDKTEPIPIPQQPTLANPSFDQQRLSIDGIVDRARTTSIFSDRPAMMLSVNDLLARTLIHAKAVKILRIQPIEDRQIVNQELGQFDWAAFFENRLTRNNLPVSLVPGSQYDQAAPGQLVFQGDDLQFQAGLRKSTMSGGRLEVRESFRFLDDDSGLLSPSDQTISALTLVYSQELLRDGGRDVVLSQALVAGYQADQSHAKSVGQVSERLQDVLNQYWRLFEIRGNYFVQLGVARWAHETLMRLQSRRDIDAQENIIEQARALLLEAQANLVDATARVRIAQDQLFRLVNDPALHPDHVEIIATHPPLVGSVLFDPRTELETALRNRGEIFERIAAISEAAVRHHVSLNQLLPKLTVSLQSSINGIDGDRDIVAAAGNAVGTEPMVSANFNLEFFLSNRTARATNRQTQLALRRLQIEYEDAIEQVRLDVSQAIRTLNASSEVLDLRRQTLTARRRELDYLRLRTDVIPPVDASASLLSEEFFLALNRLVASQQAYLEAIGNQQRSLADLQRAKGMLIRGEEVSQDGIVPVPSIPKALREQVRRKSQMAKTIDQTIMNANLNHHGPRQAVLQPPVPSPAMMR
ncbi:MAG: TolC family protein [Pirellulaceae bacterium]